MEEVGASKKVQASRSQIAGAREFLGLNQGQLAEVSGVNRETVVNFEKGNTVPHESTRAKLQSTLEARGIVFTNGDKPGFYFDRDKVIIPTV